MALQQIYAQIEHINLITNGSLNQCLHSPSFIVGQSELPSGGSAGTTVHHSSSREYTRSRNSDHCLASGSVIPPDGAAVYKRFLPNDVWLILESRHSLCRHQGGCVYAVIKVSLECFTKQRKNCSNLHF